MNKTDYYDSIIMTLPSTFKIRARIESLRFEKLLFQLNIEDLENKIKNIQKLIQKLITESLPENSKENYDIHIMELEAKIMDYQCKIKLADIHIIREEYNLKNNKDF